MDRYSVRCLYVDSSRADYLAFQSKLLDRPELKIIYDIEVLHKTSMNEALNWLASMSPGDRQGIDMIFIDPLALGKNLQRNLGKAIDYLHKFGFEDYQVVLMPDKGDASRLWAICVGQLGERNCLRKVEVLQDPDESQVDDSFDRVVDLLESRMVRKTTSSGKALQHEVLRLSARLEVLMTDVNRLKQDSAAQIEREILTHKLEALESTVSIIQNTLFQGPNTQSPSLVQQLLSLRQLTGSLDKDLAKTRAEVSALSEQFDKADSEMNLLRAKHVFRVVTVFLGLFTALLLDAIFGVDLIEILIEALK